MQFGGSKIGVLQWQDEQLEVEKGEGYLYPFPKYSRWSSFKQESPVWSHRSLRSGRSLRCGYTGVSGVEHARIGLTEISEISSASLPDRCPEEF